MTTEAFIADAHPDHADMPSWQERTAKKRNWPNIAFACAAVALGATAGWVFMGIDKGGRGGRG